MQKKLQIMLSILATTLTTTAFANQVCVKQWGNMECGPGTVDSVSFLGPVTIEGTEVLHDTNIIGDVSANNARLNTVVIRGVSHINKTMVSGKSDFTGTLYARNIDVATDSQLVGNIFGEHINFYGDTKIVGNVSCDDCSFKKAITMVGGVNVQNTNFSNPLLLNAKNSVFAHSSLQDINVKKTSDNEVQTIELKNQTKVNNIHFESLKGIVVLSGGAKILGAVQGGKVVNKN